MHFPARSDDVAEECRCAICHKTQTYIGTYLQSNKSLIAATVKLYFNNTLYLFLSLLQCIASRCGTYIQYMLRWIERYIIVDVYAQTFDLICTRRRSARVPVG